MARNPRFGAARSASRIRAGHRARGPVDVQREQALQVGEGAQTVRGERPLDGQVGRAGVELQQRVAGVPPCHRRKRGMSRSRARPASVTPSPQKTRHTPGLSAIASIKPSPSDVPPKLASSISGHAVSVASTPGVGQVSRPPAVHGAETGNPRSAPNPASVIGLFHPPSSISSRSTNLSRCRRPRSVRRSDPCSFRTRDPRNVRQLLQGRVVHHVVRFEADQAALRMIPIIVSQSRGDIGCVMRMNLPFRRWRGTVASDLALARTRRRVRART